MLTQSMTKKTLIAEARNIEQVKALLAKGYKIINGNRRVKLFTKK